MGISRRQFIGGIGGTAAGTGRRGAARRLRQLDVGATKGSTTTTAAGLRDPSKAPFDTVVVLMMENRSFDHLLGWLPGRRRQAGRPDATWTRPAPSHPQWPLAPYWQGWQYADPAARLAGGRHPVQRRGHGRVPRDPAHRRPVPDRLLRRGRPAGAGPAGPELHHLRPLLLRPGRGHVAQPLLHAQRGHRRRRHRDLPGLPGRPDGAAATGPEAALEPRPGHLGPGQGGRADRRLLLPLRAHDRALRQPPLRRHQLPLRPVQDRRGAPASCPT